MNQSEIDMMKDKGGVYIVGRGDFPCFTQLVASLGGRLWSVDVGQKEISDRSYDWPKDAALVAGPLTVQSQCEVNLMLEDLSQRMAMLEHDLKCWKDVAIPMAMLLKVADWETEGTSALAKRLAKTVDDYQAPKKSTP